jgi:hypothetical protein
MAIHEWAFEADSDVYVHANDAIKSKPYRCTDPLCTQEIRRRAGSKTPHFYHLNPDADAACGGGEGPRHKRAKELIAKAFRESGKYKHVLVEYRVGNFIVDILLQTDYGPFYFEVIDTHAPEDANWAELDGRIIPFWITDFEEPSFDDMVLLRAFELMKYHFSLIGHKIMNLKDVENKKFNFSVEDVWYYHQIDGVLKWVQNNHRRLKNYMPTYFLLLRKDEFDENEIKLGYLNAVKRLRDESRKE